MGKMKYDSWDEFNDYINKIIDESTKAKIDYEEYKLAREIIDTISNILKWGEEKSINNPEKQFQKLAEEMLEAQAAFEILENERYHFGNNDIENNIKQLKLELGDIGIVWLLLCNMLEVSPLEVLQKAHNKNNDRKGKTINGTFIKEDDL